MATIWSHFFSWEVLFGWGVVGWVEAVLLGSVLGMIGIGYAVPLEKSSLWFAGAQICFIFAGVLFLVKVAEIAIVMNHPFWERMFFTVTLFSLVGIIGVEGVRFVRKIAPLPPPVSSITPVAPPNPLSPKAEDHPPHKQAQPLSVEFGAFMANMGQDLNSRGWWSLYQSSFGPTMTPLALVIRLTITNNREIPVNIAHYSLAVDTQICGWTYLIPMHPSVTQGVALVATGFTDVGIFEFQSNSLAIAFKQPIPAHTAIDGWLLFNTTTKCPPSPGGTIRFRLELQDTAGKDYSILSPSKSFNSDISSSRSTGDVRLAELKFTGKKLDLTQVQKKLWSDLPK